MDQDEIDAAIQTYYGREFDENARLTTRSAQGPLEFERTQEVIRRGTPPPARVLDVGGATGVHAAALAEAGYGVVLVYPVASHVAAAERVGTFDAVVGDARALAFPDDSFDAVLIAGPLYHLAGRDDRRRALTEARRVCRSGGVVHASAIPRLAVFAAAALEPALLDADVDGWLDLLRVGTPIRSTRFPGGHFHTARELEEEMLASGLRDVTVIGVEGPGGFALESVTEVNEADYSAAIQLARTFAGAGHIRDFSNHLLGSGLA